jgi:hypothetical protein
LRRVKLQYLHGLSLRFEVQFQRGARRAHFSHPLFSPFWFGLPRAEASLLLQSSTPRGMGSTAVVVGDFNNDGKLDMAVLNSTGSNLTLEFGNHDGIFGNNGIAHSNFNFFGGPSGLAVADFNNDGRLDFVSSDNNDNELDILTQP